MLYQRNYKILTDDEANEWERLENKYIKRRRDGSVGAKDLILYWQKLPEAVRFHKMLFPNNYLDTNELHDEERLRSKLLAFQTLLDEEPSERQLLNFLRDQRAYFIVGSLLHNYNFGHHEAYAFKEFELPPNFKSDYLIVGKNSQGYEFILVELENPSGQITLGSGEFGDTIRKGISQVEHWKIWIEANFSHLKLLFDKYKSTKEPLPDEFFELDMSRIHFVVIAGRRKDFNKLTYRFARNHKRKSNTSILHYDNLIDCAMSVISAKNYA